MRRASILLLVLVITSIALFVHAASPTTKPSSEKPTGPRLISPYSKMTSLSDEQKTKIREIHRKVLAEIRDIEAKQSEDILALLNDDQKKELKEIQDKISADAKKAGAKNSSEEPAAEK
jgi:Spy/CpxP family protein refolding chaperone